MNIPCKPEVKAVQIRKDDSRDKTEKSKYQCHSKGINHYGDIAVDQGITIGERPKKGESPFF